MSKPTENMKDIKEITDVKGSAETSINTLVDTSVGASAVAPTALTYAHSSQTSPFFRGSYCLYLDPEDLCPELRRTRGIEAVMDQGEPLFTPVRLHGDSPQAMRALRTDARAAFSKVAADKVSSDEVPVKQNNKNNKGPK